MKIDALLYLTNNLYSTSDLALATALNSYYPIEAINKTKPKKVMFVFKKDKNFDRLIERYY